MRRVYPHGRSGLRIILRGSVSPSVAIQKACNHQYSSISNVGIDRFSTRHPSALYALPNTSEKILQTLESIRKSEVPLGNITSSLDFKSVIDLTYSSIQQDASIWTPHVLARCASEICAIAKRGTTAEQTEYFESPDVQRALFQLSSACASEISEASLLQITILSSANARAGVNNEKLLLSLARESLKFDSEVLASIQDSSIQQEVKSNLFTNALVSAPLETLAQLHWCYTHCLQQNLPHYNPAPDSSSSSFDFTSLASSDQAALEALSDTARFDTLMEMSKLLLRHIISRPMYVFLQTHNLSDLLRFLSGDRSDTSSFTGRSTPYEISYEKSESSAIDSHCTVASSHKSKDDIEIPIASSSPRASQAILQQSETGLAGVPRAIQNRVHIGNIDYDYGRNLRKVGSAWDAFLMRENLSRVSKSSPIIDTGMDRFRFSSNNPELDALFVPSVLHFMPLQNIRDGSELLPQILPSSLSPERLSQHLSALAQSEAMLVYRLSDSSVPPLLSDVLLSLFRSLFPSQNNPSPPTFAEVHAALSSLSNAELFELASAIAVHSTTQHVTLLPSRYLPDMFRSTAKLWRPSSTRRTDSNTPTPIVPLPYTRALDALHTRLISVLAEQSTMHQPISHVQTSPRHLRPTDLCTLLIAYGELFRYLQLANLHVHPLVRALPPTPIFDAVQLSDKRIRQLIDISPEERETLQSYANTIFALTSDMMSHVFHVSSDVNGKKGPKGKDNEPLYPILPSKMIDLHVAQLAFGKVNTFLQSEIVRLLDTNDTTFQTGPITATYPSLSTDVESNDANDMISHEETNSTSVCTSFRQRFFPKSLDEAIKHAWALHLSPSSPSLTKSRGVNALENKLGFVSRESNQNTGNSQAMSFALENIYSHMRHIGIDKASDIQLLHLYYLFIKTNVDPAPIANELVIRVNNPGSFFATSSLALTQLAWCQILLVSQTLESNRENNGHGNGRAHSDSKLKSIFKGAIVSLNEALLDSLSRRIGDASSPSTTDPFSSSAFHDLLSTAEGLLGLSSRLASSNLHGTMPLRSPSEQPVDSMTHPGHSRFVSQCELVLPTVFNGLEPSELSWNGKVPGLEEIGEVLCVAPKQKLVLLDISTTHADLLSGLTSPAKTKDEVGEYISNQRSMLLWQKHALEHFGYKVGLIHPVVFVSASNPNAKARLLKLAFEESV